MGTNSKEIHQALRPLLRVDEWRLEDSLAAPWCVPNS
jgi:hypothetical protein